MLLDAGGETNIVDSFGTKPDLTWFHPITLSSERTMKSSTVSHLQELEANDSQTQRMLLSVMICSLVSSNEFTRIREIVLSSPF